jgi:CRAL/TRIO domain
VLAFADVCQANLMYFLHKSFYLNLSWGLNIVYKGLSGFINEETRAKMVLTDKATDPDMLNYFHPS